MAQTARLALRVRDLFASLALYRDLLGWKTLLEEPGMALLQMPNGMGALLTDRAELDLTPWKGERFLELPRGKRHYVAGSDLPALQERLAAAGISGLKMEGNAAGRALVITDPDGYIVAYFEDLPMTDEAILDLYERGPAWLSQALEGLNEADLDLVRAPGKWSIRQTVAHVVDYDLGAHLRVKFALAESGRTYNANPYRPDTWVEGLDYASRPAVADAALLGHLRSHIAGLCRLLPDAMSRYVVANGKEDVVREMLKMLAGHLLDHLEQIKETRRIHGV